MIFRLFLSHKIEGESAISDLLHYARGNKEINKNSHLGKTMNTLQHIRYALRTLLKRPGFTVTVVLTLALGIGANTAIFSAIDAVLLNPLPYKDPDRLMVVWETNKQLGDRNEATIGNFLDWRSRNHVFDQLGSLFYTDMILTGIGEPERIKSCVVTTNFFQVVGVQPMLGRSFLPEEEIPGKLAV